MKFTLKKGFWSGQQEKPKPYRNLVPGQLYEVIQAFHDYARCEHPDEEGLTLYVGNELQTAEAGIHMQLYPDRQGQIMDNFEQYIRSVSGWHRE